MSKTALSAPAERGIFCNRTLNLRAIKAIGYDMDYTLVHYRVEAWERRAYEHLRALLLEQGWPVEDFRFDPNLVIRGLIIDTELGNLVKANRFGYARRRSTARGRWTTRSSARPMPRTVVDLAEPRWGFLNTLFSLSEACIYAQLVDLLDAGQAARAHGLPRAVPRWSAASSTRPTWRASSRRRSSPPRALRGPRPGDRRWRCSTRSTRARSCC